KRSSQTRPSSCSAGGASALDQFFGNRSMATVSTLRSSGHSALAITDAGTQPRCLVQRVLEHGERDAARGVDHPVPATCAAAARVQPASAGEDLTLMPALGEPIDRGQA